VNAIEDSTIVVLGGDTDLGVRSAPDRNVSG
jgi:hypothetical protein